MKLKELLHWEQSATGQSPSFWQDEESGEFYVQGFKVEEVVRTQAACPSHEDLVRIPASFLNQLQRYLSDKQSK